MSFILILITKKKKGSKDKVHKFDKHKDYILKKLKEGRFNYYTAEHLHAKYSTVVDYVKN